MIIHITKSKLFTVEPAERFAREFQVDKKIWIDCWLKYKLYDLRISELCDYIFIRTGRRPSYKSIKRWIIRTEIYSRALDARKLGALTVVSEFFGDFKDAVEDELLRNMKSSGAKDSRSIV